MAQLSLHSKTHDSFGKLPFSNGGKEADEDQMTSSVISTSTTSPVDSGVQFLDSESEITSVMSISALACEESTDSTNGNTSSDKSSKSSINSDGDILEKTLTRSDSDQVFHDDFIPKQNFAKNERDHNNVDDSGSSEENKNHQGAIEDNKALKSGDEQIVFRRQRKKKSKSNTPKKRVSFHEDILNSTKIDDIHIERGFITHQSDDNRSFFPKGFCFNPEVMGRYSWAAEGDVSYFENGNCISDRQVKSDMYINNRQFSSSCTSSSNSISSSVDADDEHFSSEETLVKNVPSQKLPRSSCLKKSRSSRYLITNVVDENLSPRNRKNDNNILDIDLFGSIKNILNFSTSVPLAERDVVTGQDFLLSSSCDTKKEPRVTINALREFSQSKKIEHTPMETTFKVNKPSSIILCDNNIYEHKGVTCTYKYQFGEHNKKQESSSVYKKFKQLFFGRKQKKCDEEPKSQNDEMKNDENTCEANVAVPARLSWCEAEKNLCNNNARHLESPKKRIKKNNHYSVQCFKTDDSDSNSQSSFRHLDCLKSSTKTSLINTFLRNVTVKKMLSDKVAAKNTANRCLKLYFKDVEVDATVNEAINKQIRDEIVCEKLKKKCTDRSASANLMIKFKTEICCGDDELFLQAFPVYNTYSPSGISKPLILILSSTTFYVVESMPESSYCTRFILPYAELNTILIGPHAQTIHFSNHGYDKQYIIITGCEYITSRIMTRMEMAIRTNKNKPKLPAVKQLCMRDMNRLVRSVCNQTVISKSEEFYYYSIIHFQDLNAELSESSSPNKEGPLMFKLDLESRWETAYFILKLGVLYMLSSPSYSIPLRVFPLTNGSCQGAKRVFHSSRPHTFQLVIEGKLLHLAAPDEYVASDWLQALIHAANGTCARSEKNAIQSCSLLMTFDHILMVHEGFPIDKMSKLNSEETKVLSCAALSDITSLRLPSAEQSWCILEFACREVLESTGDWILYFSTNFELENFLSTLEMLWACHNENGESFPLGTIPETDLLNRRCMESYKVIQNAWTHAALNLQNY